jgi:hypothetical protein
MTGGNLFMKLTISLISIALFAIYGLVYSQHELSNPADVFFRDVRNASIEKLPESFTAELRGQTIDKKLASIPRDSYLDKTKEVTAVVSYSKQRGITVQVMNVDELYRDIYKDLPRQFFAFDVLLSVKTTEAFLKKYDVSYYRNGEAEAVLKLCYRGAENTVLLYVNRHNYQITKIDYLLGDNLISSTQVFYDEMQSGGNIYSIPVRFVSTIRAAGNAGESEVFEMVNINSGK